MNKRISDDIKVLVRFPTALRFDKDRINRLKQNKNYLISF